MDDNSLDRILELLVQRLDSIDENLSEHMRRTDILEALHRDNDRRINLLEEPKKVREYVKNTMVDLAKFSGAVIAIISALKYFKIF